MSMKANPVNWFEIPVKDIGRAKAFYEGAFGVSLADVEMGPSKMAFFPGADGSGAGKTGASGSLVESEG